MAYGEVNNTGLDADGNIVDPIKAGAVKTEATVILDDAMNLELDNLARVQYRANVIHNVWAGSYLGCELNTLAQITNEPKESVNINLQGQTAISAINQAYAGVYASELEVRTELCFSHVCASNNRTQVAQAKSQGWHAQANLRYEEVRVDENNAQRLNNRMAMISPGRNGAVQSINALVAAGEIFGSIARQAEAAKGGSEYAAGRGIALAQQGLGALSKFLATPNTNFTPAQTQGTDFRPSTTYGADPQYQFNDSNTPYGPDTAAADMFGVDPISTPTITTTDLPILEF